MHRVGRQGLHGKLRLVLQASDVDDTHLAAALLDQAHDVFRVQGGDFQPQARVRRRHSRNRPAHGNLAGVGAGTDDERSLLQSRQGLDPGVEGGLVREEHLALGQEHGAERRGLDAPPVAVEQLHAEGRLEGRNAAREGRLADAQRIGRAPEIAEPGEGKRVLDEPEFNHDSSSVSKSVMDSIGHVPLPCQYSPPRQVRIQLNADNSQDS